MISGPEDTPANGESKQDEISIEIVQTRLTIPEKVLIELKQFLDEQRKELSAVKKLLDAAKELEGMDSVFSSLINEQDLERVLNEIPNGRVCNITTEAWSLNGHFEADHKSLQQGKHHDAQKGSELFIHAFDTEGDSAILWGYGEVGPLEEPAACIHLIIDLNQPEQEVEVYIEHAPPGYEVEGVMWEKMESILTDKLASTSTDQ